MTSFHVGILVLSVALLFVAAFLALAETSLGRVERFRAAALHEEGRRGATALVKLVHSPDHFSGYLNSVLFMSLATQIVASTALAYLLLQYVDGPLFIAAIVGEIIIGYVVTEAMPKTWAVQHTERSALVCAPIIAAVARIVPMRFVTRPLISAANLLLPGEGLAQGPFVYEQQILALADTAADQRAIKQEEHRLIHSVIEFGTTVAREVMVPRPDMFTVESDVTANEAIDVAIAKGFSRIPVHDAGHDHIIGTLFTKDLMRAVREGHGELPVAHLLRPSMFIPETKLVTELLQEMQREKFHMAVVIDEYGSVVGIVTLEDLVEEVVGDIRDEYDLDQQPQIEVIGENDWRIDARMPIDEVTEHVQAELPHGDWDTLGGLLINVFGRVPSRGESTEVEGYKIWVEQTTGRRITRVRVKRQETLAPDAVSLPGA